MNAEDFVLALLASPEKKLADPSSVDDLHQLFVSIDSNGDGYISFPEFRFLMLLLISKTSDLKRLFKIVDVNGDGAITLEQFSCVLRGVSRDEAAVYSLLKESSKRNGLVRHLFGDAAQPRECTCDELLGLIREIRASVWTAEFRQYDLTRTGVISAEAFSELLAKQVLGSHLPYHLVNNMRKLRGNAATISLEMWISLHEVLLQADELAEAVELYCASGLPVTRRGLHRALKTAGVTSVNDTTLDVLFALFDRNCDGAMDMVEFLDVIEKKLNYHYTAPPRVKKSLPTRLLECSKAAVEDLQ